MRLLLLTLEQSALFLPLALGIFLSYRILKITDLTMEGSFVLGAGSFARSLQLFGMPWLSFGIALLSGMLSGLFVTWIGYREKVSGLIAGILALFVLHSVNYQVMQRANINLIGLPTVLSLLGNINVWLPKIAVVSVAILVFSSLAILLRSRLGLVLRCLGLNSNLGKKLGNNPDFYRGLGLCIANMCAALCGCMTAQVVGYADIAMGLGVTIVGIGSVVIGREIASFIYKSETFSALLELLFVVLGVIAYFFVLNFCLYLGVSSINIKLILGLVLIFLIRSARGK